MIRAGDRIKVWWSGEDAGRVLAVLPYTGKYKDVFDCTLKLTAPNLRKGWCTMAYDSTEFERDRIEMAKKTDNGIPWGCKSPCACACIDALWEERQALLETVRAIRRVCRGDLNVAGRRLDGVEKSCEVVMDRIGETYDTR